MPFLQAVFCLKGFDDRNRFFSTSTLTLLSFIFLSVILANHFVLSFIVLVISTTVLTCSTIRRLHDAQLTKNWQLVPGGLFLLTGVLCLLIENSSSYYLLVLPLLSSALLLTYPSNNQNPKKDYIWGYYGPVDLSSYKHEAVITTSHNQRIEPTLVAQEASEHLSINENIAMPKHAPHLSTDVALTNKQADIGELIRLKFLNNGKFQLGIIASVLLIFIGVFVNAAMTANSAVNQNSKSTEVTKQEVNTQSLQQEIISNKNHLLAMPDNFNLYLSQYKGIIIHWQADQVENGDLWSLSTATGDKSCQRMSFNKGSAIRPLAVLVEHGSEYFASFSPLDSSELIQALAFRGKFSLCGYSFSLKGTQAVLGKHNKYAPYLDK